jgi:aryl-alcohol dehydrogenase-like predicted oxidoreductase
MKSRILGKSGLKVSAVGLGCMGLTHAFGPPTDHDEAIGVIRAAYDLGYRFFDTAEAYTGTNADGSTAFNEELVGQSLRDVRDEVVIATKCGVTITDHGLVADSRPATVRRSLEQSLARLGLDRVDLYYQHRQDPNTPVEEVAGVMGELIAEGLIGSWGLSEVDDDTIRRADAVCPVTAVQNRYSMMARHYEPLFGTLEELDIALVAFSPFANGFLTGRYGKGEHYDPETDYRSRMPQFSDEGVDQNAGLLALLDRLAGDHGATSGQLALAWMLNKKPWIVPIPGTRKVDRLRENAGAADIVLTAEEVAAVDAALDTVGMSAVFGGSRLQGSGGSR